MAKQKRRMSQEQEFEILKLVLDKFLWIGTIVMLYALYLIFSGTESIAKTLSVIGVGAVLLLIFIMILVRDYETIKNE